MEANRCFLSEAPMECVELFTDMESELWVESNDREAGPYGTAGTEIVYIFDDE